MSEQDIYKKLKHSFIESVLSDLQEDSEPAQPENVEDVMNLMFPDVEQESDEEPEEAGEDSTKEESVRAEIRKALIECGLCEETYDDILKREKMSLKKKLALAATLTMLAIAPFMMKGGESSSAHIAKQAAAPQTQITAQVNVNKDVQAKKPVLKKVQKQKKSNWNMTKLPYSNVDPVFAARILNELGQGDAGLKNFLEQAKRSGGVAVSNITITTATNEDCTMTKYNFTIHMESFGTGPKFDKTVSGSFGAGLKDSGKLQTKYDSISDSLHLNYHY